MYMLYDTAISPIDVFQCLDMALQREKKVVSIIDLPSFSSNSCLLSKTHSGDKCHEQKLCYFCIGIH